MSEPGVFYTPRPDAAPEAELSALASVYAYLLKNRDSKKAAEPAPEPDSPDHVRSDQDAHTATEPIISEQAR